MSYARWSADSSVYIFDDATMGGITCCECSLLDDGGDFNATSRREMIAHVEEHLTEGHLVPGYVIPRLREGECTDLCAAWLSLVPL